jgi:hypothetical protein
MTEIKVINAGLCRTGTMSTRQAFIDMGFQNCYHMQGKIVIISETIIRTSAGIDLKSPRKNLTGKF